MKKYFYCWSILFFTATGWSQKVGKLPESKISAAETAAHLRFLAADEMQGRRTGEQGNLIAARYIAEQFRLLGLKMPAGQNSYLQKVNLKKVTPSTEGVVIAGADSLKVREKFIALTSTKVDLKDVSVVHVGFGWVDSAKGVDDYRNLDIKGKIVVAQIGSPDAQTPFQNIEASDSKLLFVKQRGGVGLVEIFTLKLPWQNVVKYFSGDRVRIMDDADKDAIPHLWVAGDAAKVLAKERTSAITLKTREDTQTDVPSFNVAGILEGSDPTLKNEYVILSAHFDHVGTGKNGGAAVLPNDTIFNGTRDNAFGTSAMLFAAKCLSQVKPKRSVLFLGFTGEEMGLLGSQYYAKHPLVPLDKCVFNLNTDGAGYNDTTIITVMGLERTGCKTDLETATKAFGLKVIEDPAPEQNLFDRSDNVSFAAKGIPAPTFSPGFTKFDDAIFQYYHQVTDNPESISYGYFHKYCQSFTYAARLIANRKDRPRWATGDKYEAAFRSLYGVKN